MKKSFKKAGAAVLSMAMLLSMGAVTMPVYAELDTHEKIVPTQVEVTIANTSNVAANHGGNTGGTGNPTAPAGVGDDANHHYYYLDDLDEADVEMYRVATVTDAGWKWVDGIEAAVTANDSGVESDFVKLLEKTVEGGEIPKMDSDDLGALAGLIQRTILGGSYTPVAKETIHKLSDDSFETIVLPKDDTLFSGTNSQTTKNIVGYYILITKPKNTGYVMQPVLVPISNHKYETDAQANSRYTKKISLKGTSVEVDKDIVDIVTYVDSKDKVAESFSEMEAAGETKYSSRANIDTTKDLGVVDADDIIQYRIMADVPVYSKNAASAANFSYYLTDTPDAGINVITADEVNGSDTNYRYVTATTVDQKNANPKMKVYYSTDSTFSRTEDVELHEYYDYMVETNEAVGKGKGFIIRFDMAKLRGKDASGNLNTNSALYHAATEAQGTEGQDGYVPAAPAYSTSMEGGHIFVEFYAETDKSFNSAWAANDVKAADKTAADVVNSYIGGTSDLTSASDPIIKKVKEGGLTETEIATLATKAGNLTAYNNAGLSQDAIKTALGYVTPTTGTDAEKAAYNTKYDNMLKAALYLALSEMNLKVDEENKAVETGNANKNGTKNVAKLTFENTFTGDGSEDEVTDTTKLFAAKLDLTKKALEFNVKQKERTDPIYIKTLSATEVSGTASGENFTYTAPNGAITKTSGGTDYVYLKWDNTAGAFSKYETTTNPDEATDETSHKRMYVTAFEETPTVSEAKDFDDGSEVFNVYVDKDNSYSGTTVLENAKTQSTPLDEYGDDYAHDMVVSGAVFKLEEAYSLTNAGDGRVQTQAGNHLRSYAITNASGKLKQLKLTATSPVAEANLPTIVKMSEAEVGSPVYCEKIESGADADKYNVYELTADDAWDRIGEGVYNLTEVQAPAGYKKWSGAATLNIRCELADEANIGKFTATSNSTNAFWSVDAGEPSSQTVTATFSSNADGTLQNEILNMIDDSLPQPVVSVLYSLQQAVSP